jgi:hypothetical protein
MPLTSTTTTDTEVPWNGDSNIARDLPPHLRDFAWLLSRTVETFGENSPDIQRLWSLHRFLSPNPQSGAVLTPAEDTWVSTLPPGWRARVSKRGGVEYVQTLSLEREKNERVSRERPKDSSESFIGFGCDLVGLVGTKGVGKDTAGRYLVDVCGWHRVASGALGVSVRRGAQVLGTELVRNQLGGESGLLPELGKKGLWIQHMERSIADARCKGRRVVITDVRFPDEAAAIIALGGKLVYITRPRAPGTSVCDPHVSENQVEHMAIQFHHMQVVNSGSADELGRKVMAAIEYMA